MAEPRARRVDWARQEAQSLARIYSGVGPSSGGAMYGLLETERARDVLDWWNSGAADDPRSAECLQFIAKYAKRAKQEAASQTKSVRSAHKGQGLASMRGNA